MPLLQIKSNLNFFFFHLPLSHMALWHSIIMLTRTYRPSAFWESNPITRQQFTQGEDALLFQYWDVKLHSGPLMHSGNHGCQQRNCQRTFSPGKGNLICPNDLSLSFLLPLIFFHNFLQLFSAIVLLLLLFPFLWRSSIAQISMVQRLMSRPQFSDSWHLPGDVPGMAMVLGFTPNQHTSRCCQCFKIEGGGGLASNSQLLWSLTISNLLYSRDMMLSGKEFTEFTLIKVIVLNTFTLFSLSTRHRYAIAVVVDVFFSFHVQYSMPCLHLLLNRSFPKGLSGIHLLQKLMWGLIYSEETNPVNTKQRWFLTSFEVVSVSRQTFREWGRTGSCSGSTGTIRAVCNLPATKSLIHKAPHKCMGSMVLSPRHILSLIKH